MRRNARATTHSVGSALAYLWSHYYGRLALLSLVVGGLGLVTHVWLPIIFVAALWLPKSVRDTIARDTPAYRHAGLGPRHARTGRR